MFFLNGFKIKFNLKDYLFYIYKFKTVVIINVDIFVVEIILIQGEDLLLSLLLLILISE